MRSQFQSTFGTDPSKPHELGDCYATCVANILDLPRESVPNFCAQDKWAEFAYQWFLVRGLGFMTFPSMDGFADMYKDVPIIASGKSPRGTHNHSVIWMNGRLKHDPHPDGTGLDGAPTEYDIFIVTSVPKFRQFVLGERYA